ncbi:DUF6233 domain-containing protein [Streptomyces sp. NPDC048473]|uniref:DUF6233 domain-containing protein n=1 Tax=unclassified Streptomyces TaxID=2593676 RepID=UPI003719AE02
MGDQGRQGVVHAGDCEETPAGAPVLTLERVLDAAQHPGTRLCALCGAAAEPDPVLKGFEQGFGGVDQGMSGGSRVVRALAARHRHPPDNQWSRTSVCRYRAPAHSRPVKDVPLYTK